MIVVIGVPDVQLALELEAVGEYLCVCVSVRADMEMLIRELALWFNLKIFAFIVPVDCFFKIAFNYRK